MATLELFATAATVIYVLLTVRRSMWQFPTGLVATGLFLFVFMEAKLYASSALQVLFAAVQAYGWWYWLHGRDGERPRITSVSVPILAALVISALAFAGVLGRSLQTWTEARMTVTDSAIFSLSAVGQFLLSRKVIEHWLIWMMVNGLAAWVYASQHLWITAALYAGLFASALWGLREWRDEQRAYNKPAPASSDV